jgi:CheY-like chemotaxis protein
MGIPYVMVNDLSAFAETLSRKEWFFVFTGYDLYDKIKPIMDSTVYPNGKKPSLALMVEWDTEAFIPNVRFIPLPVKSFSIANTLNGETDRRDYFFDPASTNGIRFTISGARLLIVDDIAVNLKVTEGLLAPYRAVVDTCLSGKEAIEMIKRHNYDIVFMDHMMPEMNGIEATAAIRIREKERMYGDGNTGRQIPIIALTANVVSGMREVFIENGFSDFLAKPIDTYDLYYIIDRWIPKEKKEFVDEINEKAETKDNALTLFQISGIDTARGITMTGGTEAGYLDVLSLFCKDVEERLPILQGTPDDLSLIAIHTHALKNASAYIGATEISEMAVALEAESRARNLAFIRKNLPAFAESLAELARNIRIALKRDDTGPTKSLENLPPNFHDLVYKLAASLESQRISELGPILKELRELSRQHLIDEKIVQTLEQVSDQVLIAEYGEALKAVKELFIENSRG